MNPPTNAIGQAVFIRTDVLDYSEVNVPFQTLEELVNVCSEPRPRLTLERVIVFSLHGGQPSALTLGFISASKGVRPRRLPPRVQELKRPPLAASEREVGENPGPLPLAQHARQRSLSAR